MERIELYPIFNRYTVYNDHYDGELDGLGDALGRDCTIAAILPEKLDFTREYKGDGSRNEDWFSWNAEVFAPVSGKVISVYINDVTNVPGQMNSSKASTIVIQRDDEVNIILAHIQNPVVSEGGRSEGGTVAGLCGQQWFLPASAYPHWFMAGRSAAHGGL